MGYKPIEYILESEFLNNQWSELKLVQNTLSSNSSLSTLHYAQSVFEGMRIEKFNNQLAYFRLNDHLNRLNNSSKRFCIPTQNVEKLQESVLRLSDFLYQFDKNDYDYIYVRPLVFGSDESLIIKPSQTYKLQFSFCLLKNIDKSISARIEYESIKTHCGDVKFSGNYASSFLEDTISRSSNFDTTLWTRNKLIEEFSSMNLLCFDGITWFTPKITKNILDGITKKSFSLIFKVEEKELSYDDLKKMKIVLGSGSAVGLLPISKIDSTCFNTLEGFEVVKKYKQDILNKKELFDIIKNRK